MTEFTEKEYGFMMSAVINCNMFKQCVNAGLPVHLTDKTYHFDGMTTDEEIVLMTKLNERMQIAWLKENKS